MEKLNPAADASLLTEVMKKYHFTPDQWRAAERVAERLNMAVRQKAGFWYGQTRSGAVINSGRRSEISTAETGGSRMLTAALTLGHGVDELQEQYVQEGQLLECYMAEVLAGELLLLSYGLMNDRIKSMTGLYVAGYQFFGSGKYPLEGMRAVLAELPGAEIICNETCCLIPKKSVVLLAELTADESVRCAGVCAGCDRTDCANRCGGREMT